MLVQNKIITLKENKVINLRSPKPEDAENILTHLKTIFNESYKNMNNPKDYWDNYPIEEEVKILTKFSSSAHDFMISAFDGEKIIGNIGCSSFAGQFQRYNAKIGMGIEKRFQNLGLGTALINYAIETAKQNNIHRLELNVRSFNEAGINLYEKSGFRRVGVLKEYAYIDNEFFDEYIYEKLIK